MVSIVGDIDLVGDIDIVGIEVASICVGCIDGSRVETEIVGNVGDIGLNVVGKVGDFVSSSRMGACVGVDEVNISGFIVGRGLVSLDIIS